MLEVWVLKTWHVLQYSLALFRLLFRLDKISQKRTRVPVQWSHFGDWSKCCHKVSRGFWLLRRGEGSPGARALNCVCVCVCAEGFWFPPTISLLINGCNTSRTYITYLSEAHCEMERCECTPPLNVIVLCEGKICNPFTPTFNPKKGGKQMLRTTSFLYMVADTILVY